MGIEWKEESRNGNRHGPWQSHVTKKKQGREEMDCGSHVGSEYLKRKPIILTKDVI